MAERFPCELISQGLVYEMCWELAAKIRDSGFAAEIVVAVARGGFAPARYLCDFLGISAMTSIKIQHYAAGGKKQQRARVRFPLSGDISGRRVLLVDDVNDTGDTLLAAVEHLDSFAPSQIRTAVLHEKLTTRQRADYRVVEVKEWHWIIYPWAIVEDISGFLQQMQRPPSTPEAAAKQLWEEFGVRLSETQLTRILAVRDLWLREPEG